MASCGLDRVTGLPLYDLDHVLQHIETIFSTRRGEMITLEHFGCGLPELLGRRVTPDLIGRYRQLLMLGIGQWEPRLLVNRVFLPGPNEPGGNSASKVALGRVVFAVWVYYRPRGHLGDPAVEGGRRTLLIGANDSLTGLAVALAP